MPADKSDILQGTLDLMVLKTLAAMGPLHGYGIARRIEQISEEALQINQGTIYASLVRLIQKRWISGTWGTSDNNRKAKFYSITKAGRKQLHTEAQNWERISTVSGRMLRKNPGFTAVAVLTLALGIGANTAIFSVVYAVLLKPLPYGNPDQLYNVFQAKPQEGVGGTGWSYANFTELREQNRVFSEMAGSQQHQLTLTGRGEPSVVNTSVVTPELFSLFGEKPLAGRAFFPEDGKAGAPPVVILSENLWRSSFGADPNTIGSAINLDKRSFTVVGIMPAAFRFPLLTKSEQLWIPLVQDPLFGGWMERRGGHWLQVTGCVKPGVSMTQVRAELDAFAARFAKEFPAENDGWAIRMVPLPQMIVGRLRAARRVLLGV